MLNYAKFRSYVISLPVGMSPGPREVDSTSSSPFWPLEMRNLWNIRTEPAKLMMTIIMITMIILMTLIIITIVMVIPTCCRAASPPARPPSSSHIVNTFGSGSTGIWPAPTWWWWWMWRRWLMAMKVLLLARTIINETISDKDDDDEDKNLFLCRLSIRHILSSRHAYVSSFRTWAMFRR